MPNSTVNDQCRQFMRVSKYRKSETRLLRCEASMLHMYNCHLPSLPIVGAIEPAGSAHDTIAFEILRKFELLSGHQHH